MDRPGFTIIHAEKEPELSVARTLFREYVASLSFSLDYQGIDDELASLPGRYNPPSGCILLAMDDERRAIGCIALRQIDAMAWDVTDGRAMRVCEMKRMYVPPAARGRGIARALAERLIAFAQTAGYERMKLDTEHDFIAAVGLYRSLGFVDCPRYNDDPQPNTIWMCKDLPRRA